MNETALPIRPEDLLRHQEFVGALARRLVRDPHAAQDLAQETWLTALRRPPRSAESLRGWLARVVRSPARGERRAGTRREDRERTVARSELDSSAEQARERLALQQSVVAAVLELREPYRSVVLLRWFEDLPAGEIARRRGVPAGTVRAQLSRALAILRERLDAEHGGDRSAWSVALLALAGRRSLEGVKWATLAAGATLVAGLTAIPLLRALRPDAERKPASPSLAVGPSPVEPPPASAAEPAVAAAYSSGRQAVETVSTIPKAPQGGSFANWTIGELMQAALEVQALLRERLLAPGDALRDRYAALLAEPNTGLARILRRERFDFESNLPLGLPGGGAFLSFTSRSHNYADQPQVVLDAGSYNVALHGGQRAFIADLDDSDGQGLPSSGPPARLSAAALHVWHALALEGPEDDAERSERVAHAASKHRVGSIVRAEPGHLYLVRSISSGEYDVLAAFRTLESDEYGHTILWRILRSQPEKDRGRGRERIGDGPPPAHVAAWLDAQSVEELLETQRRLRDEGERRMLGVPEVLRRALPAGGERGTAGVARILSRGVADPLIAKRGGGAFFSFVTAESSYDREPNLTLEAGRFRSGFHGAAIGFVLELGDVPLDRVAASMDPHRPLAEAWRFLWTVELADPPGLLASDDLRRADELGLRRGAPALANTTYLLRSISSGEHDVLAAFRTVDSDAYGYTIAWRLLRSVPLPGR
ncbi:MAG TPA: sigma-70 family RNA polymerase sigma factor [Planctomycetota bacterium]|nr:sigma-70 family RNA polymerase sigma factor [Planctomycetota bacterium]